MEINKEISYLIGLFQTDGSMSEYTGNKGNFSIELSSKDEDIIYKIKELIPYNYNIKKRTRKTIVNNREYNNESICLRVYNLEFRTFLNECGIPYGKKSKIIKPPLQLKDLSIKDYLRGLYDGDGSLGFTKTDLPYMSFTTDSDSISKFIVENISKITKKPLKKLKRNNRDNIYNICITKEDTILFVNELYYDNCLSIKRKYDNAQLIKKWKRPITMKKVISKRWNNDEDNYILNNNMIDSMKKLNRTDKSIKTRLWRLKKRM